MLSITNKTRACFTILEIMEYIKSNESFSSNYMYVHHVFMFDHCGPSLIRNCFAAYLWVMIIRKYGDVATL